MSLEDSDEIRKMFYNDSFGKKRIGSNVHKKTGIGSENAGVRGGVKFAQKKYKKYEKNSKVNSFNLYNSIITYNDFLTYTEDKQCDLLLKWISKYSNKYIYERMNISVNKFYKLLNYFNLNRKDEAKINRRESRIKNIDDSNFKDLPDAEKYKKIKYLQEEKGYTNKYIADKIGYKLNTFNTMKSIWRKDHIERGNNLMKNDDFLIEDDQDSQDVQKEDNQFENVNGRTEVNDDNLLTINFNNESISGNDVKNKCEAVKNLTNNDKRYELYLIVKEK